jgi:starch-binding outer membrane protein SusE/F
MKRYCHQIILLTGAVMVLFSSCIKEHATVYSSGGTAPVLTSTATDSISLPVTDTTATAVTFTWTNPNYTFSNGISSLDVNYYLEIDTMGANFTSPTMAQVGITSQLSSTFTVAQLNGVLTNTMFLDTSVMHNIQVRIASFLAPLTAGSPKAEMLYSSALNFTVTPYATPPAVPQLPSALWVTGDATADGWMTAGMPATIAGQQMTELSPTLWTITMPLIGGQQFLLVPANNWNNKYATTSTSPATTGGTFSYNSANNFNGPAASGTYTITFNFQTGTYTITQ